MKVEALMALSRRRRQTSQDGNRTTYQRSEDIVKMWDDVEGVDEEKFGWSKKSKDSLNEIARLRLLKL